VEVGLENWGTGEEGIVWSRIASIISPNDRFFTLMDKGEGCGIYLSSLSQWDMLG
jgi:hypothetical protein